MRRRGRQEELDDDEAGVEEDELDEEEERPRVPRRPRHRRRHASHGLTRWRSADDEEDDEDDAYEDEDDEGYPDRPGGLFHWRRRPVFFRARDSWYFEPLLALAIIVVLLVSLWAYTQNWPPVFVVKSSSMQHGTQDQVGLLNTGDLVLVQKVGAPSIVSYELGAQSGYTTYGEYGDVLLYEPDGQTSPTPIIHRAILVLDRNPDNTWTAPDLAGFGTECGNSPNAAYSISSNATGCGWNHVTGALTLYHVGWKNATVTIALDSLGSQSGFVTMGDNNYQPGSPAVGLTDQVLGFSALVQSGWIVGVARGMIPWFGSVKLLLEGNAQQVPVQSWQFLGLTLVAAILGGVGLHYVVRAEGIEDPRRKAEEEEKARSSDGEDDAPDEGPPLERRWRGLRGWLAGPDAGEEEPVPRTRSRRHPLHRLRGARGRGRPRPKVRRSGFFKRHRQVEEEPDEL